MSNRLPVLATEIQEAHADVLQALSTAAECAIAAGHALQEAKELIGHGKWLPWLNDNCAIPERTAQRYMVLAKSHAISAIVADFGIAKSAKQAALGLKLWPSETQGYELIAVNAKGEGAYGTITPRSGGLAEYYFSRIFEDQSKDFWCGTGLNTPFALGLLHTKLTADFPSLVPRRMNAEETDAANTFITEVARAA